MWNNKLNLTFHQMNFTWLFSDQCIYIRHTNHDLLITLVHTDDMTIFGSDQDAIARMKVELNLQFQLVATRLQVVNNHDQPVDCSCSVTPEMSSS
jgi:hypothetical protein